MDHVAVMRPSWGLTQKILTGEKSIESRWYRFRRAPFGAIHTGDWVYFKNAGKPVAFRARVRSVLEFSDLCPEEVNALLVSYGRADGILPEDVPEYFQRFKDRRYCLLVFLEGPESVVPFSINKAGFGSMASWISVPAIDTIRIE